MLAKRLFDLFFTIPGLFLLFPLFIFISALIRWESAGSVFFRQVRVGKAGRSFRIYKFRTMVVNAEELGAQITVGQDQRITRVGAILRRYKIDELPQLLNVFWGDMSLVGPRPEVPRYVAVWPENLRQLILSVPPGITDYASIEFKNENEILAKSSEPEQTYIQDIVPIKLTYYEKYVRERSLRCDFILIIRTVEAILRR